MNKFLTWLAYSPLAQAAEVAAAAVLTWVIDNLGAFNLPPVVYVAAAAGLPVIADWLNKHDWRFGRVG